MLLDENLEKKTYHRNMQYNLRKTDKITLILIKFNTKGNMIYKLKHENI